MRNSLNVALPVTANFIDLLRLGLVKARSVTREGLRYGAKFTVAKGSQRHRINLARRIARWAIATCPAALKGWRLQWDRGT